MHSFDVLSDEQAAVAEAIDGKSAGKVARSGSGRDRRRRLSGRVDHRRPEVDPGRCCTPGRCCNLSIDSARAITAPTARWSSGRSTSRRCEAALEPDPRRDARTCWPGTLCRTRWGSAATWYFLDGRRRTSLLGESVRDLAGNSGLHVWRNGDTPSVFVNATDRPIRVWTSLPARSFFVHPAADGPVAVGWLSPIERQVTMTARVADAHPGGRDGVGWRLESMAANTAGDCVRWASWRPGSKRSPGAPASLWPANPSPRSGLRRRLRGRRTTRGFMLRGDPEKPGAVVPGGAGWKCSAASRVAARAGSGRRQLARLADRRDNPLAARVMVNRVWQYHFGQGLVATPNDFGSRGQPPTHPELLDWLAAEFVDSGWQIKPMHRLIMLSAAYQRVPARRPLSRSDVDPDNHLYWRFERRGSSAEELRDSLLAGLRATRSARPAARTRSRPRAPGASRSTIPFSADYHDEQTCGLPDGAAQPARSVSQPCSTVPTPTPPRPSVRKRPFPPRPFTC